MTADNVTITMLWDKLDAVEQRISQRITDCERRLSERIDANTVAIAHAETLLEMHGKRLDCFDDTVRNLKAWDKAVAAIAAIIGPAIAFLISALRRGN